MLWKKTMRKVSVLLAAVMVLGTFTVMPASAETDMGIPRATGATVTKDTLLKEDALFSITDFGAVSEGGAENNTTAINAAIMAAYEAGGGTVVVPAGDFSAYTIVLQDNVNIRIDEGGIIRAGKTDIYDWYGELTSAGEGGNYMEPEVNLYTGLQDHGHTYFANSLFYGADKQNVMIYGEGLIDGSYINDEGYLENELQGYDPSNPDYRTDKGTKGIWYGNKAIALVRCENVVISDIDILNGGHFAIIAEGVINMTVDGITVDTNRDAFNIDCCQDVTVSNSVFNSLTDDAIVLKASYGTGTFMPTENILIENCTVSGYDAGSVLAGTYTTDKLVATDRCGPTARIKLGTEATCGFDTVTVTGVTFDRSRGFCLESVDGSVLTNIVLTDCTMRNVSSSPIFIRVGDRGRFPVTGMSEEQLISPPDSIRLNNSKWVLPNTDDYTKYPAMRYVPQYDRATEVTVDGASKFKVVNQDIPTTVNLANIAEADGKFYTYKLDEATSAYAIDFDHEITEADFALYANAVGAADLAKVSNIEISDVTIENVDPRYPILLAGLVDSRIENVVLKDISVEYRGGLSLTEATEQRQVYTDWAYSQHLMAESTQTIPWLVNTFFSKSEGLLPRVSYNAETGSWYDDPYNVPELPNEYPESSILGILPAYALYARHVDGLTVDNVSFRYIVEDSRSPIVLDDVHGAAFTNVAADTAEGVPAYVFVTSNYKRATDLEYVHNQPYIATTVSDVTVDADAAVETVTVNAPAPGTPNDDLYSDMKLPTAENGYSFAVATEDYALPLTVYRPYFSYIADQEGTTGEALTFTIAARNPANGLNEDSDAGLVYSASGLPEGAAFDAETQTFTWASPAAGEYTVTFTVDDGVIPVSTTVAVTIQ